MSKKTQYYDEQMIHTLANNGESQRQIAIAMDIPRRTVRNVLDRVPKPLQEAEIVGDGCSYLLTDSGASMNQDPHLLTPLDIEEMELNVSDRPIGQLQHIDSGYPDIYYDERHKKYEVFLHGRRIWRDSKLSKACKVRLSKGELSKANTALLRAVVEGSAELQAALDEYPM